MAAVAGGAGGGAVAVVALVLLVVLALCVCCKRREKAIVGNGHVLKGGAETGNNIKVDNSNADRSLANPIYGMADKETRLDLEASTGERGTSDLIGS